MADEAEIGDVVEVEESTAETYMEVSVGGKKDFKPYWVMLYGSTLYYFTTELEAKPKGKVEIAGATLEQEGVILGIRHGEKDKGTFLRTSREDKTKEWLEIFNANKDKPAHEAPERQESAHEKKSLSYRAQKAFGSKFAGSKAGAATLTSVDEDINKLTGALKDLVKTDSGKEKADYIHRGISKLIVKAAIEWNRETIKVKDLRSIDTPLRAAFNKIDRLFQLYKRRKGSDMKDEFKAACDQLSLAVQKVREMLRPFLTAKNMMLLQDIGEYLCNPEWWIAIWDRDDPEGTIENNLYELVHAMARYTQIELPVDDDASVVTAK